MAAMRVVPKATVSRDDIHQMASTHGWVQQDFTGDDTEGPFEEVWLTQDGTTVHWIEDDLIDVGYLAVDGDTADSLAARLSAEIDVDDIASLRAQVMRGRDRETVIDTLYRVAVVAGHGYDEEAFRLLRWGLYDPDPLVRRVALIAVSITAWSAFRHILSDLESNDSDMDIRTQAGRILDIIEAAK